MICDKALTLVANQNIDTLRAAGVQIHLLDTQAYSDLSVGPGDLAFHFHVDAAFEAASGTPHLHLAVISCDNTAFANITVSYLTGGAGGIDPATGFPYGMLETSLGTDVELWLPLHPLSRSLAGMASWNADRSPDYFQRYIGVALLSPDVVAATGAFSDTARFTLSMRRLPQHWTENYPSPTQR